MLSPRSNNNSSSIISLSSFDTIASLNDNQFISYHNNTNNNKNYFTEKQPINTKSFDQTINQAVEYFEQILDQCVTSSDTSLIQNFDQQERKNDMKSKLEVKKRDCEDFLRSLNKKQNFKIKRQEQNRRIAKYYNSKDDNDSTHYSKNGNSYGSTFYCRKALLQKPDGITYICIRKRFD
jgi:hypothetical protein